MIKSIIIAILEFIAGLIKSERPQVAAKGDASKIKKAAAKKIKGLGLTIFLMSGIWLLGGCYKTVYIEPGDAVRLRETVKGVKVWVKVDGAWEASEMTLPEGWYCIYLTDDEINNAEIK